ncbi:PQQ-binding-like beta-propeller repeat protein [Microlunatus speluncae]|uniref:PQQ-binding-like beta-propeller repeat protein n=1 Tax=Microlunatus speluncae TaxID=2594267 RepID=UPI0012664DB1|nr:PQQ-binding-like beta-propeller repeat protein [Microlunatus speluncae]
MLTVLLLSLVVVIAGQVPAVGTPESKAASTPPPPAGELRDLGATISSLTVVEGAYGKLPDGTFVAYAPVMGENAELNVTTSVNGTNTVLGHYPMPGASGGPTIAVGPDGVVYVGTYYQGHLYAWNPATKEMSDLGQPVAGETYLFGLSVAPDGTVFGGTYPNAHVFSYHPDRGFTDYGKPVDNDEIKYLKSTVYDPDQNALFVGTQPIPKLFKLDLASKTFTESQVSAPFPGASVIDLDYAQGRVLANVNNTLRVFDSVANREVDVTDASTGQVAVGLPMVARGVSEPRDGKVYFSRLVGTVSHLSYYDLATDTVTTTRHPSSRGALIGYGWTTEGDHEVLYSLAGNYSGGGFRYDPVSDTAGTLQYPFRPAPAGLQHVLPNADGSEIFFDAFLNGSTSKLDVESGVLTPVTRLGQAEDWTLGPEEETTIYAGVYPNGTLIRYRPDQPAGPDNPKTFATLKTSDAQIRPLDVQVHDGVLYAATAPDYGLRGGAIAAVDLTSNEVKVTRNVVQDHTMASLAFLGDKIFAGSSTEGGTGTDPIEGTAKLVEWDPATRQVVRTAEPVADAESINALTVHNGRLYGLADSTVFEFDPVAWKVIRKVALDGVGAVRAASRGELIFHPNGYLYASVGESNFALDPFTLTGERQTEKTYRLELSADRDLLMLVWPEGFENPIHYGRFTPAATPCETPDTRDKLTIGGVQTPLRNRFVITGCTLQDVVDKIIDGGSSGSAAARELDRYVAAGTLTARERGDILRALR